MNTQNAPTSPVATPEKSPSSPRLKAVRSKRFFSWIIALIFLAVVSLAISVCWAWIRLSEPFQAYSGQERFLEVSKGMSKRSVAEILEKEGVIRSAQLFILYDHFSSPGSTIKAGEYRFAGALSTLQVLDKLRRGDIYLHRVTVPEGFDLMQIAETFASAGFGAVEELSKSFRSKSLIQDIDPDAEDLEGYLFPDTYHFGRNTEPVAITAQLVGAFRETWTEEFSSRAKSLGMTVREVITLASLIEKETARAEERSLVSSVFHNRLERNVKLACDPTVIYAVKRVKEYDGVINQSDLRFDSPYNTYLYPGLPPGPIASPGREAIMAALHPAETDLLFFVSKNDGSHVFSKTYREHSRAVQQYQR